MRTRIWNNLANIKFKAIYTSACSKLSGHIGNTYSFFLALASATSVATWAIWEQYPKLWACIIGVSQVLLIAKPYIPFIKNDKEYLEMSFEFEALYLAYEKLWYEFEYKKRNISKIDHDFYEYREKEIQIERMHKQVHCPELKFLIRKSNDEARKALNLNFTSGVKQ